MEGKQRVNSGDILHLLEIVVLLISVGISYERFNEAALQVEMQAKRLERVEHYLSSRDTDYWRLSKENQ